MQAFFESERGKKEFEERQARHEIDAKAKKLIDKTKPKCRS